MKPKLESITVVYSGWTSDLTVFLKDSSVGWDDIEACWWVHSLCICGRLLRCRLRKLVESSCLFTLNTVVVTLLFLEDLLLLVVCDYKNRNLLLHRLSSSYVWVHHLEVEYPSWCILYTSQSKALATSKKMMSIFMSSLVRLPLFVVSLWVVVWIRIVNCDWYSVLRCVFDSFGGWLFGYLARGGRKLTGL